MEDQFSGVSCLQEREIEDLVRGSLDLDAERRCQAHLMWCQACQNKVEEEAEFAQATRSAAIILQHDEAEAEKRERHPAGKISRIVDTLRVFFSTRFSMRWVVVAASAGVLVAMAGLLPLRRGIEGQDVVLRSERGSAVPVEVDGAVSASVRLRIDVSDVAPAPAFKVTIVDAAGRTVETRTASATAGNLTLALHGKLAPGRYWVRLSAPEGRLLREYALRVRI